MTITTEEKVCEVLVMLQNHFKECILEPNLDDLKYPLYYSDVKNLENIDHLYIAKGYLDKNVDLDINLDDLLDKDDIALITKFVDNKIYFHEDEVIVGYVEGKSLESIKNSLQIAFDKINNSKQFGKSKVDILGHIDISICDELKKQYPLLKLVDNPGKQKVFLLGYYGDIEIELGKKTGQIFKLFRNLLVHHDFFQDVLELMEDIKLKNGKKSFKAKNGTSEELREVSEYIKDTVSNTNKVIKRMYKLEKVISVLKKENDSKQIRLILNNPVIKNG